jgi:hypothetical protein
MGKAVQLRGTPQILAAFDRIEIPTWALFYENKCLFKCVGESMSDSKATLEGFLKQLERSNTTAMYDLRFYEDLKDKKKIKAGLDPDYSYNVMLFDAEEYPSPGTVTRREGYAQILQRMDEFEARQAIRAKEEEEAEEEDEPEAVSGVSSILGFFNRLLDNPEVQNKLGQVFSGWIDNLVKPSNSLPMNNTPREIGAIGSAGSTQPAEQPMITKEQADKIQAAITILAGVDPELGDHLEAIAQIAQKKPAQYRSLITMLKTFV